MPCVDCCFSRGWSLLHMQTKVIFKHGGDHSSGALVSVGEMGGIKDYWLETNEEAACHIILGTKSWWCKWKEENDSIKAPET